ncbi:peptidyl-prolyl cis-trans isomerase C [Undibacterium sp. GrIS 1.2]|uniref:peptidylprolyl isomerase n=1 Tax=Undibacterium sp. GrIS 1.2 TaxID=3143933 RepID=UPI003396F75E
MFIKSRVDTRILLASAASLLILTACNSQDASKAAAPSKAAATVNGTPISQSIVDLMVKQRAAQGQPDTPESRKEIIDHLALQYLVSQEAVKKGLDKTPEVIDQTQLTKESILANAYVQDYLKTNVISDDMLKAEYEKIKVKLGGNEYKARHILVATEAEAKDIIAKLQKDPSQFEALAKQKTLDAGSKASGGDLGWFDPARMVPEFGAAVAKLEKGKFTVEPVKSQFGYHVILLEDSRAKVVPSLDEVKDGLKQQVQQESLKKLIDDIRTKAKIEMVNAPVTVAPASAPAATAPAADAVKK